MPDAHNQSAGKTAATRGPLRPVSSMSVCETGTNVAPLWLLRVLNLTVTVCVFCLEKLLLNWINSDRIEPSRPPVRHGSRDRTAVGTSAPRWSTILTFCESCKKPKGNGSPKLTFSSPRLSARPSSVTVTDSVAAHVVRCKSGTAARDIRPFFRKSRLEFFRIAYRPNSRAAFSK